MKLMKGVMVLGIWEFALQVEADSEKYYREQALKTKQDDIKAVLNNLANDEHRHYKIIQDLQKQIGKYIEADHDLSGMKRIFASYQTDFKTLKNQVSIDKLKDEQADVYRVALIKEQESVALYRKMQTETQNDEEKRILEKLAKEEAGHVEILEAIIELLNHVNDWVESAEFNNPDTY